MLSFGLHFFIFPELFDFNAGVSLASESKDVVNFDLHPDPDLDQDFRFCTLPRRREGNRLYQSFTAVRRPASTAGV